MEFYHKKGNVYHVTGKTINGQRFKIVTSNAIHAFGINLHRGTRWLVLHSRKRQVLQRIYN